MNEEEGAHGIQQTPVCVCTRLCIRPALCPGLPTSGSLPGSLHSTLSVVTSGPIRPALLCHECTTLSPQLCAQGPYVGRWHTGPGQFVDPIVAVQTSITKTHPPEKVLTPEKVFP